jgi:hypothetical protein
MTAGSRLIVSGGVAPDAEPRRLHIEMVLLGGTTDDLATFTHRAHRCGLDVIASAHQTDGRFYVTLERS